MTTVLVNGKFWRFDGQAPYDWLVITGSVISDAGHGTAPATDELLKGKSGSPPDAVKVVDLEGQWVFPGLQDAHLHVYSLGESQDFVDLSQCRNFSDIQKQLRAGRERLDAGCQWLVGVALDHEKLEEGRLPTRSVLDAAVPDVCVFVWRVCHHVGVGNTAALQKVEIPIKRDDGHTSGEDDSVDYADGVATGILREGGANPIRLAIKDDPPQETRLRRLAQGVEKCLSYGLTGLQTNDPDAWHLYQQLHQENRLNVRIHLTIPFTEMGQAGSPSAGDRTEDAMLRCERIKLFADGSLGASTAALRIPYKCKHNHTGMLLMDKDQLQEALAKAYAANFRAEVHAIGDQAADAVLSAMEALGFGRDNRLVLTHCQVLGKDLIDRMSRMSVIANIQPSFLVTDAAWLNKRLDDRLIPYCYAWKTLLQAGVPSSGGSDAPIETVNPLRGMYDAIFRDGGHEAATESVFLPHERLTFEEALDLYTRGAAYACKCEDSIGKLEPGYFADLTVLREDVIQHPELLLTARPSQVWVNGIRRL